MIDWHSHILPDMDDGSSDTEESISMLNALKAQGIECVVATPHFLANDESIDEFLQRRETSFRTLCEAIDGDMPKVLCGAEVKYYAGIGKMEGIERLCIEGGRFLLVEMPMSRWNEYTIKDLCQLSHTRGLNVIVAHVERCLPYQSKDILDRLAENGIYVQINASLFKGFFAKKKALGLIRSGRAQFIGSDCHNMTTRTPQIGFAYDLIRKKFGDEFISQMRDFGYGKLKIN